MYIFNPIPRMNQAQFLAEVEVGFSLQVPVYLWGDQDRQLAAWV